LKFIKKVFGVPFLVHYAQASVVSYRRQTLPIGDNLLKLYIACLFFSTPLFATVNVRSYGAAGDGATNDTAALNEAFQAGCSTADSVYLPKGVYQVDPLALLNGCGATFYGDGSNESILRFRSSLTPGIVQSLWSFGAGSGKTLTIRNLALQGMNAELAGISVNGYSTVALTDVNISNFGTPGYAQNHRSPYDGLNLMNSENATIADSGFTGNERYGIELQAVHNSTVSNSIMSGNGGMGGVSEQNFDGTLDGPLVAKWLNNTLVNNGSGGIDVETDPTLPPAQGVLEGNHVTNCGNNNWGSGWGLVIGNHSFGVIENNEIHNFAAQVPPSAYSNAIVYGSNGGPIQILNNTVTGTPSYGILGNMGLYPVTITGNTVSTNGTGIFIYNSPWVQISSNIVTNDVGAGISVYWSDGSSISGNQYSANNPDLMINGMPAAAQ
jgi:parallel beta-helix repeat protein